MEYIPTIYKASPKQGDGFSKKQQEKFVAPTSLTERIQRMSFIRIAVAMA